MSLTDADRLLVFYVGQKAYAVSEFLVKGVKSIYQVEPQQSSIIPALVGGIKVGNDRIHVARFNQQQEKTPRKGSVIILDAGKYTFGLVADRVQGSITPSNLKMKRPESHGDGLRPGVTIGVVSHLGDSVEVVDPATLFHCLLGPCISPKQRAEDDEYQPISLTLLA